MILEIQRKGVRVAAPMRQSVIDHVRSALDRFTQGIRRVTIQLADDNGPRGGVDKHCLIAVQLAGGRVVRAGHTDARLMAAAAMATDRVVYAVGRALQRRRRRTGRRRPWESEPEA